MYSSCCQKCGEPLTEEDDADVCSVFGDLCRRCREGVYEEQEEAIEGQACWRADSDGEGV